MKISEKIKKRRKEMKLSQTQLGELIGVSTISIFHYEKDNKMPRKKHLEALARVLNVSEEYLTDDSLEEYIPTAPNRRESAEAEALIAQNQEFFAGKDVPQAEKDAFFEAIMRSYLASKE